MADTSSGGIAWYAEHHDSRASEIFGSSPRVGQDRLRMASWRSRVAAAEVRNAEEASTTTLRIPSPPPPPAPMGRLAGSYAESSIAPISNRCQPKAQEKVEPNQWGMIQARWRTKYIEHLGATKGRPQYKKCILGGEQLQSANSSLQLNAPILHVNVAPEGQVSSIFCEGNFPTTHSSPRSSCTSWRGIFEEPLILGEWINSHFAWFRSSPISPPMAETVSTSLATSVISPPRVTSSINAILRGLANERRMGCMARQNKSGPMGSPCCTPSENQIVNSPNFRDVEKPLCQMTKRVQFRHKPPPHDPARNPGECNRMHF